MNRAFGRAAVAVILAAAVGCGGVTGELTGTVSYNGKPVSMAAVVLDDESGSPRISSVDEKGGYRFDNVPVGAVKLGVVSPDPTLLKDENGKPLPESVIKKWQKLPPEKADPRRSGFEATVAPGPNSFDIVVK